MYKVRAFDNMVVLVLLRCLLIYGLHLVFESPFIMIPNEVPMSILPYVSFPF